MGEVVALYPSLIDISYKMGSWVGKHLSIYDIMLLAVLHHKNRRCTHIYYILYINKNENPKPFLQDVSESLVDLDRSWSHIGTSSSSDPARVGKNFLLFSLRCLRTRVGLR